MTKSFTPRAVAALAALALSGLGPALALEPPTKEQVRRYQLDGTFAARAAQAKAIGNHRIRPRTRARLDARVARLAATVAA